MKAVKHLYNYDVQLTIYLCKKKGPSRYSKGLERIGRRG